VRESPVQVCSKRGKARVVVPGADEEKKNPDEVHPERMGGEDSTMGAQLPESERPSGRDQRRGVEQPQRSEGMRGILRRALAYADRVFQLKRWWKRVRDSRRQPQIPTGVFHAVLVMMFLCRLRSFHELPARPEATARVGPRPAEQYRDR